MINLTLANRDEIVSVNPQNIECIYQNKEGSTCIQMTGAKFNVLEKRVEVLMCIAQKELQRDGKDWWMPRNQCLAILATANDLKHLDELVELGYVRQSIKGDQKLYSALDVTLMLRIDAA